MSLDPAVSEAWAMAGWNGCLNSLFGCSMEHKNDKSQKKHQNFAKLHMQMTLAFVFKITFEFFSDPLTSLSMIF